MTIHLDNALGALSSKQHGASTPILEGLARCICLVQDAVQAARDGDRDAASRLLTAAADVEFRLTGDADSIGPLFDALGVPDGAEARLARPRLPR
jgi:hypothetical protein